MKTSHYNEDVKKGTKQMIIDLKNPIFLSLTLIFLSLLVCSFFCRKNYPRFYLSLLQGFNAFLIAWFARLGLVFLPGVFVFLSTFEHLTNMS